MSPRPTSGELLDLALATAREASSLVRERRTGQVSVAATKSSDIDVVTQVDRDSEALIRSRILAARPDDGFLGEEEDESSGSSGIRWVVDPIDGTVNYLYGLRQYAVSIAAERDGAPVAGVVVDVASGTEYTAAYRLAADGSERLESHRDGYPLRVRDDVPLAQRLVGTGFHYVQETRRLQAAAVARLLPEVRDIRRLGSCALDLCHVAEGALDGYVEEGVNPWDHAAGGLVAEGAGATLELTTGVGGRDLLICAPAAGFRTFRDAVRVAGFLAGTGE